MLDNQLVGLSLLPVSFFGAVFNWLVVIIIIKEKTLKSPFMLLTFVKSLCDSVYLTIYVLYMTPMVILNNPFLVTHSHIAGYFLMALFETSIHTHFITSMNRFAAVFFPISYKTLFSLKSTQIYLIIASIISFAVITVVHYIFGCRMEYNDATWIAFYNVTIPICEWYTMYGDFMKNLVLVFVDFGVDIVTLLKVQRMRRQFKRGKSEENYTKKETDFLKQTCGQGFCYLLGYASYLMVPEMNTNKYVAFFMSVMSWCVIAMADGLFTIVYNCEIRTKLIKEKAEISVVSVTSSRR